MTDLRHDLEQHLKAHDPMLVVMVGPSGAGKSTLARNLPHPLFNADSVVESDSIRIQLIGVMNDFSRETEVWEIVYNLVSARINYGLRTVLDATNIYHWKWKKAIDAAMGRKVTFIVVDRPLEEKHRDAGWRATVELEGKNVIDTFHERMQEHGPGIFKLDGTKRGRVRVFDCRT